MTFQISNETIISLIDLTHLQKNDKEDSIIKICQQAQTPFGDVASVYVYPEWLEVAKKHLNSNTKLGTVANFPKGDDSIAEVTNSVKESIKKGAEEIDVVIPYKDYINGNKDKTKKLLHECRKICKPPIILKAILETGALQTEELIKEACKDAILAGVDFVKTSTGKIPTGITEDAVICILEEIINSKKDVGIKLSGGIHTRKETVKYLSLVADILGEELIDPDTCRIGTTQLLFHLLEKYKKRN